jgi:hypothetical protein
MTTQKLPQYLDLQDYKNVGNLAVDMVCHGIIHERKRGLWVKTVRLDKKYWKLFCDWAQREYGEEIVEKAFFIDTVCIEEQLIATGKILTFEYEVLTPKAEA